MGQESLHLFLRVDDLDHHRQIHRKAQNLGGVNAARGAEAHRPAQHGRAGEMQFARLEHDRLVERLVLPAIAFADKNAQERGVFRKLHMLCLTRTNISASARPSQTATRQQTSERTLFKPARNQSPSRASSRVCRLKEEKVV